MKDQVQRENIIQTDRLIHNRAKANKFIKGKFSIYTPEL